MHQERWWIGVWVSSCTRPGGENLLAAESRSEGGWVGGRKGFVFKWGSEVGEIDRLSLHTTERRRAKCV